MYYGSVDRAMLFLFASISEGIHWSDLMRPLTEYCSPWLAPLFVLYVTFAIFAMMNIVTGIFLESAIATANDDKRRTIGSRLRRIFSATDRFGKRSISAEDFIDEVE